MTGREESNQRWERQISNTLTFCPRYMDDFVESLGRLCSKTKRDYVFTLKEFLDDLDVKGYDIDNPSMFEELKPSQIIQFIDNNSKSQAAKCGKYYALRKLYQFLVGEDYIDKDPTSKIEPPKPSKQKEAISLTEEEILQMLSNISHPEQVGTSHLSDRRRFKNRNLCLVKLGLTAGARCSSILEINVEDIDFENGCITVVQKGDKYHDIYLADEVMNDLRNWIDDRKQILEVLGVQTNALFINYAGSRMINIYFNDMLKWATCGIDKHITSHKLRSTCATRLYEQTKDINLTARMLGHSNVKTTMRYIRVEKSKMKSAADILCNF